MKTIHNVGCYLVLSYVIFAHFTLFKLFSSVDVLINRAQ